MALTAWTITATQTIELKNVSDWAVGRWLVSITKDSGAGTFTVKPQKRVCSGTTASPTPAAYADCWYMLPLTNTEVAAGTTQAATTILDVDAAGCDVQLVFTLTGANSITLYAAPLIG